MMESRAPWRGTRLSCRGASRTWSKSRAWRFAAAWIAHLWQWKTFLNITRWTEVKPNEDIRRGYCSSEGFCVLSPLFSPLLSRRLTWDFFWHVVWVCLQVLMFAEALLDSLPKGQYALASEHEHSCCVLLAHTRCVSFFLSNAPPASQYINKDNAAFLIGLRALGLLIAGEPNFIGFV